MTLTEFLTERIGEDEAIARALADSTWQDGWDGLTPESWAHFQRFDPARVLAECEAKRRILQRCADSLERYQDGDDDEAFSAYLKGLAAAARSALWDLAGVYANHPDYRQAWTP